MARRIQRKRTKGWRMPDGVLYVGRPSTWGSPFKAGRVYRFADDGGKFWIGVTPASAVSQVHLFERFMSGRQDLRDLVRAELAGKDLACWCPLNQPCHADVLLRIANEEVARG